MTEGINWLIMGPALLIVGMIWVAFMSGGHSL